ncbi:MAG: hypothetical protein ACM3YF_05470 [Candidatus Zixiibacteriota bacterium]
MMNGKCCNGLFNDLRFAPLKNTSPPKRKGVYVVKVKSRGRPTTEIIDDVKNLVRQLNWETAEKTILKRISRIEKVGECPTIYIGSAGTNEGSKNTLANRYFELSGHRHTAMYPIWALVFFGWELEFGWKIDDNPKSLEKEFKRQYCNRHSRKLPALVVR